MILLIKTNWCASHLINVTKMKVIPCVMDVSIVPCVMDVSIVVKILYCMDINKLLLVILQYILCYILLI